MKQYYILKKNRIAFLVSAFMLIFTACDMNKMPEGKLSADDPFTFKDCQKFHIGLYSIFQSLTTGEFVAYGDLQMDDFHSILGFSGSLGAIYGGKITPNLEPIENIWGGNYYAIGHANKLIFKIDELVESNTVEKEESLQLRRYKAEALFTRAFCNFDLSLKFCEPYTAENVGKEHGGLPLVTQYNPTSNNTRYPGRSTLEATFKLILEDLDLALEYLETFEAEDGGKSVSLQAMSPWINSDIVKAFQARVALYMRNYEIALKKSENLINAKRYALISNSSSFQTLWLRDIGTENIWIVTMTIDYRGNATGAYYLANEGTNMGFIPTQAVLNLFETGDIRTNIYFGGKTVNVTGASNASVKALMKYPGNAYLYSSVNNFTNMGKPFRISEQYLIAAEAAAMQGKDFEANDYLNSLRRSRIAAYKPQQLTGGALLNEIKEERRKELLGEGFRMSDLKRWGDGFLRSAPQNLAVVDRSGNVHLLSYPANDYRFTWPIPQAEIDVNPQIKDQQNQGY